MILWLYVLWLYVKTLLHTTWQRVAVFPQHAEPQVIQIYVSLVYPWKLSPHVLRIILKSRQLQKKPLR